MAAITAERHDLAAVLRHRVRLCAHRLLIRSSDGWERAVALEPKSGPQFYAEVMAARRELDRDQRGSLGKAPPSRPGTCFERPAVSTAANVAGWNPNPAGISRAYSGCQALRSPTPNRVREVGDPAAHARVRLRGPPAAGAQHAQLLEERRRPADLEVAPA